MSALLKKTRPQPRWLRRKEARPSELLHAALDLFIERGFSATRLEDVASRAGVSKGTLYLYFVNKEELFKAVIRQGMVPFLERAEHLIDEYRGSSRDLIKDITRGWWETIGATPLGGIPKLVVSESGNFPELARFYLKEVIHRGQRICARALQRGMDSGEFRKMDVNYVLRIAIAPIVLLLIWQHSLQPYERKALNVTRYLDMHLDILLEGIRSRGKKRMSR
ncbi:MAG TPA: TetR/AcrR family transcriptional regulator [Burkholderiales bacterium]|nr:TetR/AcrR family transcriptional regulator [Burkholderiales bacterium]